MQADNPDNQNMLDRVAALEKLIVNHYHYFDGRLGDIDEQLRFSQRRYEFEYPQKDFDDYGEEET